MIYHVFCFDFDFPEADAYLGYAEGFEAVRTLIANRSDVTRDFAQVYFFDLEDTRNLILAAQWYYGGGMDGMDSDGWRIIRSDLVS